MRDPSRIWDAALGELRLAMSQANFESYLAGTTATTFDEDELTIAVANPLVRETLEQRFRPHILRALYDVVGRPCRIRLVSSRGGNRRTARVGEVTPRPVPTVLIGIFGGLIVGMTSVGSGSLMIVLLLFVYPMIGANQLVGTDLTQAVPLTAAAALGALAFGHVEIGVTTSLIIGSVPAVLVGSLLSSTVPDRYIRPVIAFVIFASGLKYVGLNTTALGWTLCGMLFAAGTFWLVYARPWRKAAESGDPELAEHLGAPVHDHPPEPAAVSALASGEVGDDHGG